MCKRTILSEVNLLNNQMQINGCDIKNICYGNKLLTYLFPQRKKRVIESIAYNDEVSLIVCCRDTAKMIVNYDFPNLKLIQLTSTGYDGVPIQQFAQKGIAVSVVKGVYDIPIAEMVLSTLLQYYRRVAVNPKRKLPDLLRRYNSYMGELYGKKAIVLGTGNIGQCIAKRLSCFGVTVDGYNRRGYSSSYFNKIYNEKNELIKYLSQYEFVISTLPLTEQTRCFCDHVFFENMNAHSLFLNVGRKETVDKNALYSALRHKRILGAIVDEVELFPFWPFNKFRRLSNTLILPGIATSTVECKERAIERIKYNIGKFIEQGYCDDLVSKEG